MTKKFGPCQDIDCDDPDEESTLNYVKYIMTSNGPAWICDGCLEAWDDEQTSINENRVDMNENGYNTGAVLLR